MGRVRVLRGRGAAVSTPNEEIEFSLPLNIEEAKALQDAIAVAMPEHEPGNDWLNNRRGQLIELNDRIHNLLAENVKI